ncbi:MAG: Hpt domain-containing protein [Gammaproteobacteria bacterium]|jgi:HPt (histidine-containing phosphotransfer) domain-containing protein
MKTSREERSFKGLLRCALDYFRHSFQTIREVFAAADTAAADGNRPPEDDPEPRLDELDRSFSSELFARLLMELPGHRRRLATAYANDDPGQLGDHIHRLLGCAAYCEAPELVSALRELRLALKTDDRKLIDLYYTRAVNVIDSTLIYSGYNGEDLPEDT